MTPVIQIRNARTHNLKNIHLDLPKNKLIVFTGISGSGKSSLAFDTLYQEGQRQFLESLGEVTDLVSKPAVDRITGLAPSIAVNQIRLNSNPRSTVGTMTEIFTYLRILFGRLGRDSEDFQNEEPLTMTHFSFNKPKGACPKCTGIGSVLQAKWEQILDETKTIEQGAVLRWDSYEIKRYSDAIKAAGRWFGFEVDLSEPVKDFEQPLKALLKYGTESEHFLNLVDRADTPQTAAKGRFEGLETNLIRRYREKGNNPEYQKKMNRFLHTALCPECRGERLNLRARTATYMGKTIIDLTALTLEELSIWLKEVRQNAPDTEMPILYPILEDLDERVNRCINTGLNYLTLNREVSTLSGGEYQRFRLAALIGSGLTGVLYVLDEPTTGLHSRDTEKLLKSIQQIRDLGNTIVVIEHDPEFISAADIVVEIGPGAGSSGGRVIHKGSPESLSVNPDSVTGPWLKSINLPNRISPLKYSDFLSIKGAAARNLKNIDVDFPVGQISALTGVSGSGKTSLLFNIVEAAGRRHFESAEIEPGPHHSITGFHHFDRIISIDQKPMGRTSRSNSATYTGIYDHLRKFYASLPGNEDLKASDFSFNVPGGRCETCSGTGTRKINMHFLPDVEVPCEDCGGKRFKDFILNTVYRDKNINDVLNMTINEAYDLFIDHPGIINKLKVMKTVGLGYLQLGQPASTFSGGEAQRIKLTKELGRPRKETCLYLLDEPTTGLHPADLERLMHLLNQLKQQGHTIIIIEHNLQLIARADWIVDLGPEGGNRGGGLMAAGTVADIMNCADSFTGKCLKKN